MHPPSGPGRPLLARTAALSLLLVLAMPLPGSAAESVYRWVDASGVVHYDQVAPAGVAYEVVRPGKGPDAAPPSLAEPAPFGTPVTPGSGARGTAAPSTDPADPAATRSGMTEAQREMQTRLEAEERERLAELRAARDENCRLAREQFEQFTTFARIRMRGADGEYVILSEEERQAKIDEAKEAILLNCDGAG
ncbi:MAG: DUF4124 domain-containing protein [Pseudomonadales bacterium]|jgi:hypothetical protein|nr:DUF4124 domain-containing protein [Pseudomonadales bacterium]